MPLFLGSTRVAFNLGDAIGTNIHNQSKSVTPSISAQTVTPDPGYTGLSQVVVNAIPNTYTIPGGVKMISEAGIQDAYSFASVNVPAASLNSANMSISINPSTGVVYATGSISTAGWYNVSDSMTASYSLLKVPGGEYTPQSMSMVLVPSGRWVTSSIIVNAIPSSYINNTYKSLFEKTEVSALGLAQTIGSYSYIPSYAFAEYQWAPSFTYNATTIGNGAFYANSYISSIALNYVQTIGNSAFANCENLVSVTNGNSVRTIGVGAFENCSSLITVGMGLVESVGDRAFKNCIGISNWNFPMASIIGNNAFENCTTLSFVDHFFSSIITTVGNEAFKNCTSLVFVNFASASTIGSGAFSGCTSLMYLNTPQTLTIGDDAFNGCTALCGTTSSSSTRLLLRSVSSIGARAFKNCTGLIEVAALATYTGAQAFYGCGSLTSIDLNASVINGQTFALCTQLKNVTLGNATIIGPEAFSGCTKLVNITLPNVTSIALSAFKNCTSLSMVSTPKLMRIASFAFSGCTRLSKVYLMSTMMVQNLGGSTTFPMTGNWLIYVPSNLYNSYRTNATWSFYSSRLISM